MIFSVTGDPGRTGPELRHLSLLERGWIHFIATIAALLAFFLYRALQERNQHRGQQGVRKTHLSTRLVLENPQSPAMIVDGIGEDVEEKMISGLKKIEDS
jgi:hypothetical protein